MKLVYVSWYLGGVFLLALVPLSAITVMPEAERLRGVAAAVLVAASALFCGTALFLRRRYRKAPDAGLFRSRWVSTACAAFAVVITLLLLAFVGG